MVHHHGKMLQNMTSAPSLVYRQEPSAPIMLIERFIEDKVECYQQLRDGLEWEQRDTPRAEYYCNDVSIPYTYGRGRGIRTYEPKPWHPIMRSIQRKLESFTGIRFEVCFANAYVDQTKSLHWHSDDSPEMDDSRPIAIVSLGQPRGILFRRIERSVGLEGESSSVKVNANVDDIQRVMLPNGSLCLMAPGMQDSWQHRIPKGDRQMSGRISLTYRGYAGS